MLVLSLIGGVLLAIVPFALPEPGEAVLSVVGFIVTVFVFLFVLLYTVVLSAAGGYLGATLTGEDVL